MKKFTVAIFALSLALPLGAHAEMSKISRSLTDAELQQYAVDHNLCDDRAVVSARYVSPTDDRIQVTCGDIAGAAAQPSSGLGGAGIGLAALAGLGLVAIAAGGGSSSTSGTNN